MIKNLQVWLVFGILVTLAFVAMFFISRSNIVIERSRSAAETRAVRSRMEARRDHQVARAIRKVDQTLARLISLEAQRSPEAYSIYGDAAGEETASDREHWQDDGFAIAFFVLPSNQDHPTSVWAIEDDLLEKLLPNLHRLQWEDWFSDWQDAKSTGSLVAPNELYELNNKIHQAQVQAAGQEDSADSGSAAPRDPTTSEPSQPRRLTESTVSPIYAVWIDGQLCLVRQVQNKDSRLLQGCVLQWSRLKDSLQRNLKGDFEGRPQLIPYFDLYPETEDTRFCAWAPMELRIEEKEAVAMAYPSDGGWVLLGLGWIFLALTCGAIGLLLQTVLRMSNRREAFVSSVTHELRTPLTAFRLYADLLAKAPDPEKTKVYAKTLQTEAERLSHLVENVLCYSRMEKRGITSHHRVSVVGEMLDAMVPRLEEHCFRSGMILDFADASPTVRRQEVLTDPSAVDRILVNLVDNACKYGRTDDSQVIELVAKQQDKWLVFEVADSGPGLAKAQRRRLFKAYNHGHIGAESPNTTIGLGLNICFNLAKALGGSLSFEDNNPGCRFILKIPMDLRSR